MMLNDVACAHRDDAKCRDLIRRIESRDIDQALPAEMELAVMWAVLQLGGAEIEPEWFGATTLPDAFSTSLIPGYDTVIEIAALSDAALPTDEGMRNASRKLSHEAGRLRKGSAKYLSYYFFEESRWENRESLRWVKVPRDLSITNAIS